MAERPILPRCVDAFIISILCGNPILKGAWITLLNSMIVTLQAQVAILTLQITRLNVAHQFVSLASNTIKAVIDKTKVDLNLFLGPLQQFSSCAPLLDINKLIQSNAVNKTVSSLKKIDYNLRRYTSLTNVLNAQKAYIDEKIAVLQDFLDRINEICP